MAAQSKKKSDAAISNRKASHDYTVLERFEAGLQLRGSEVKSVREGKADLAGGFVGVRPDGLFLLDVHISPYEHANQFNHDPNRPRRLLFHKRELASLRAAVERKGLTLVPLRIYFKRGWAKVEIGLCRGKQAHDKRETLRRKTATRETARAVADARNRRSKTQDG